MRIPSTGSGFLAPVLCVLGLAGSAKLDLPLVCGGLFAGVLIAALGVVDRRATVWGASLIFVGAFVFALSPVIALVSWLMPQGMSGLGWFITVVATGAAVCGLFLLATAYLEKRRIAKARFRPDDRAGL